MKLVLENHDNKNAWDIKECKFFDNGWGAVIFPRMRHCRRTMWNRDWRAFIYFLEAWAQIVVSLAFGPFLGTHYVSFCDSEAAKHALLKGYGKDECINNMLGMFWTTCAIEGSSPWFERVTSEANQSDEISRDNSDLVMKSGWLT